MKFLLCSVFLIGSCVDNPQKVQQQDDEISSIPSSNKPILSNQMNETTDVISNIFPFTNNRETATEPPLYSCRGLISDLTDEQIDIFVTAIESGDYSVLIPFMSHEFIQSESKIRNEYYSYTTNELEPKELTYTFSQAGKIITYINQYGFLFINSKEVLWDLNDVVSILNYRNDKHTFYTLMEKVFATEDPQEIIDLYNDYNTMILYDPFPSINITINELTGRIEMPIRMDQQAAFYYLFPILYPSKEEQRIYLINHMLYSMFIFNGVKWIIRPPSFYIAK